VNEPDAWDAARSRIGRDALGVGIATGAYGLSFGALAAAGGFSIPEACVLSLLMFTGGSQFALVSTISNGGTGAAGAATAVLLGSRNALYGLRLSSLLRVRGARRAGAAQLVIDESTAMAVGQETDRAGRFAFYATGLSVFALWNLATLIGAIGAQALDDPADFGLDAAASAAFVALLAPRVQSRQAWVVALGAMAVALVLTPLVPAGVPVLCAALVAVVVGWRGNR
jgi:predicted branched-subunit amino acid permease